MPLFRIRAASRSVIGNFRDRNEDRVYRDSRRGLFIVADGIGGMPGGERASQLAVDTIQKQIMKGLTGQDGNREAVVAAIRGALLWADEAIVETENGDPELSGMGTTVALLLLHDRSAFIAHLGDSRVYRARAGRITQLTDDHTLPLKVRVPAGPTGNEVVRFTVRPALSRFLGRADAPPDIRALLVQPGGRFLLATDGLTGVLRRVRCSG